MVLDYKISILVSCLLQLKASILILIVLKMIFVPRLIKKGCACVAGISVKLVIFPHALVHISVLIEVYADSFLDTIIICISLIHDISPVLRIDLGPMSAYSMKIVVFVGHLPHLFWPDELTGPLLHSVDVGFSQYTLTISIFFCAIVANANVGDKSVLLPLRI